MNLQRVFWRALTPFVISGAAVELGTCIERFDRPRLGLGDAGMLLSQLFKWPMLEPNLNQLYGRRLREYPFRALHETCNGH